jgi:hypothetical protein
VFYYWLGLDWTGLIFFGVFVLIFLAVGARNLFFAAHIRKKELSEVQTESNRSVIGRRISGGLAIALGLAMAWSFTQPNRSIGGDVIAQHSNPTGTVDAFLVRHATASGLVVDLLRRYVAFNPEYYYSVYLRHVKYGPSVEIMRADDLRSINLTWKSENELDVAMPCGHVISYSNSFHTYDPNRHPIGFVGVRLNTDGLCHNSVMRP